VSARLQVPSTSRHAAGDVHGVPILEVWSQLRVSDSAILKRAPSDHIGLDFHRHRHILVLAIENMVLRDNLYTRMSGNAPRRAPEASRRVTSELDHVRTRSDCDPPHPTSRRAASCECSLHDGPALPPANILRLVVAAHTGENASSSDRTGHASMTAPLDRHLPQRGSTDFQLHLRSHRARGSNQTGRRVGGVSARAGVWRSPPPSSGRGSARS
jgi:hypothetical protein